MLEDHGDLVRSEEAQALTMSEMRHTPATWASSLTEEIRAWVRDTPGWMACFAFVRHLEQKPFSYGSSHGVGLPVSTLILQLRRVPVESPPARRDFPHLDKALQELLEEERRKNLPQLQLLVILRNLAWIQGPLWFRPGPLHVTWDEGAERYLVQDEPSGFLSRCSTLCLEREGLLLGDEIAPGRGRRYDPEEPTLMCASREDILWPRPPGFQGMEQLYFGP